MPLKPDYVNALLELFYPRLCLVCGEKLIADEKYICLTCLFHAPRTNFHLERNNQMEEVFYGRVPIERATAFFEFKKGSNYQKILHHLKYKGMRELGEFMGNLFAYEIKDSEFAENIELICPVPLHPRKEQKRGYNQSYYLSKGISEVLQIPVENRSLIRKKFSSTQTRKSRYERWENVEGIFDVVDPLTFAHKHILLIDDVVTTGATLEACAATILKSCNCKISILTLAIA